MTTKTPRRRPVRIHFRTGIEAALRADPRALAECAPRTQLGAVVRSLVLEAGRGKAMALRQMLTLLDWEEPEADEAQAEDTKAAIAAEPEWDWNESADWNFTPRENSTTNRSANDAAGSAADQRILPTEEEEKYFKDELRRRFARLHESDVIEAARRAELAAKAAMAGNPVDGAAR